MGKTIISWTDYTFNPWMGCSRVSLGCTNCYAERMTKNRMGLDIWGQKYRKVTKSPWQNVKKWNQDARINGQRKKVFIGSLCDIFEDRPELVSLRRSVFELIRKCDNLDFQLLSKRAKNIEKMLPNEWGQGWENVWLGVSIENQDYAWRADILREIPSYVRFISYEPALGSLELNLSGIDWVIYGGESGPKFRSEEKNWARVMMEKCRQNNVAFFISNRQDIKQE